MKGSTQKVRKAGKQPARLRRPIPVPVPEPVPDLGGRPTGAVGLRKSLILENCGEHPSATQLQLIDSVMKLEEMRKGELPPRELVSIIGSQRALIKLVRELSGKSNMANGDSNRNPYSKLTDEQVAQEQECIDNLYRSLPSATSGPRLENDDQLHSNAHLLFSGHKHFKDGSWDYDPDSLPHDHKEA